MGWTPYGGWAGGDLFAGEGAVEGVVAVGIPGLGLARNGNFGG